ncbi:MAG: MBL fold metallo-hydrolase [Myxococcales bacterium]|nr:MAG: MBL fold metallo-hydrolase [Myxococcales bacterium]
MPTSNLADLVDPNFPLYCYTLEKLTPVYDQANGKKTVAKLFMGEWVKLRLKKNEAPPSEGRAPVLYRGGQGYVDVSALSRRRTLEIFFIDVGVGDSILIQTPDDRRVLIDGGQTSDAYDFIRNKYRLDKPDHYVDFEAVIATHCDMDHAKGLIDILTDKRIAVKRVFHNGLFKRNDDGIGRVQNGRAFELLDAPGAKTRPPLAPLMKKFVEAVGAAKRNLPAVAKKMKKIERWRGRFEMPEEGFTFRRLDAAEKFLPPFDDTNRHLIIEVLWPRATLSGGEPSYKYYRDVGKTVNGNSIVLRVVHGRNRILLTGDLNAASMGDLVAICPGGVEAEVYKAAHHGSQDFTADFVRAVKANAAVISSGDDKNDQHGHPRAVLLGSITRHSRCEKPAVFCTELAACFQKLSAKERKSFQSNQLYERTIRGVVHLRSDRERLYLGTVHGIREAADPLANVNWKWDVWPDD